MSDKSIFQPNDAPAGGWGALHATAKALREESAILKGGRSLLSMNQPDGFDCPGCAWPDPKHTSSFEFCENGAKACRLGDDQEAGHEGVFRDLDSQ